MLLIFLQTEVCLSCISFHVTKGAVKNNAIILYLRLPPAKEQACCWGWILPRLKQVPCDFFWKYRIRAIKSRRKLKNLFFKRKKKQNILLPIIIMVTLQRCTMLSKNRPVPAQNIIAAKIIFFYCIHFSGKKASLNDKIPYHGHNLYD